LKKILFLFIALHATVCAAQPQAGVVAGVIEIQLQPETAEQVHQLHQTRRLNATPGQLQVGIRRFDELNTRFGAASLERIFPDAGEHEEKHRRAGLHLWYRLHFNKSSNTREAVKAYGALDEINAVSEVYPIKRIQSVPAADALPAEPVPAAAGNDPYFSEQWHYHNTGQTGTAGVDINLPEAWDITTGSTDVIVAVVDGGIDYTHPDIAANMWSGIGRNFINNTNTITPEDHGTHVAGTIAAVSNNGIGVAGIAGGSGSGNGVRLMSCQIFDNDGGDGDAVNAIVYAADHGAVICQNSWGYKEKEIYNSSDLVAIRYFINYAGSSKMKGGIVIFSAGNEGDNGNWYPGAWQEVLSVAAVGPTGRRANYSNYGATVDISAPGGDLQISSRTVLSTIPNGRYGWMQGTSMACPHVSGVAALVLSKFGSETYTPELLRERLLTTASPLPNDSYFESAQMGAGLVNAFKAVSDFVAVTGITLPAEHNVQVGRTDTLHAVVHPADATNQRIQWTSSSPDIAAIDEAKGIVTGVAEGTATITVITGDGGFMATTAVNVLPVFADSIRLAPQKLAINAGATGQVAVLFYPFDVTRKELEWHSKNEAVAAVDENGQITGVSLGNTYIVATTKDGRANKDSCLVTVVQPVTGIRILSDGIIRLVKGDTVTLHATVIPGNAYNKTIFWSSNNTKTVIVKNNILTAKDIGNAIVTVRTEDGNYTATVQVEVFEMEHVPQGFSPNSDGMNDYFVCTLDSRDTYTLSVFDRSGREHYRSSNYKNDWDGIANTGPHSGSKVPGNTYFYTLSAKKSGIVKKGFVVIKY
jgi:gliding motility-associated-like protein